MGKNLFGGVNSIISSSLSSYCRISLSCHLSFLPQVEAVLEAATAGARIAAMTVREAMDLVEEAVGDMEGAVEDLVEEEVGAMGLEGVTMGWEEEEVMVLVVEQEASQLEEEEEEEEGDMVVQGDMGPAGGIMEVLEEGDQVRCSVTVSIYI